MAWMLVYLLSVLGNSGRLHDQINVDVIERNVCYDDKHEECFTQYIFWEWLPYLNHHGVVAWTMAGDTQPPIKRGEYFYLRVVVNNKTYTIRGKSYCETYTHQSQDPERLNRFVWPETLRRGLK